MSKFTPSRTHIVKQAYTRGADLTVSGGIVTTTHSHHRILSEHNDPSSASGAYPNNDGADDLDKIQGPPIGGDIGHILILSKVPGGGAITVKDNAGGSGANYTINCTGDRVLGNDKDVLVLMWQGTIWVELTFGNNV